MKWAESILVDWREEMQQHRSGKWQPHIMVVDDEEPILRSFKSVLESCGCNVETFLNGEQALERFRLKLGTRCPPYDLVFLDLRMPRMTGDQVLGEIRKLCPRIPVVIVTAFSDSDMLRRAADIGYFGLVVKPFDVSTLQGILNIHRLDVSAIESAAQQQERKDQS